MLTTSVSNAAEHLRRRGRHAARTAACLVGAATVALAAPTIAAATVDQTTPQWAELGQYAYTGDQASGVTAVYTIQNVAEPNTEMLEDNNNQMTNGAVTDVWQQVEQGRNQPPNGAETEPDSTPITQANYLWEFVPNNPNQYSSIVSGPGELINRQSGLCLDAVGTDPNYPGDGTAIDQWACNGGPNQQWTAISAPSGWLLSSLANKSAVLGVGNPSCSPQGSGDKVYLRTTGLQGNTCDQWTIEKASYDFATYPITVRSGEIDGGNVDGRGYSCAPGWQFRQAFSTAGGDETGGAYTATGPVTTNPGDSRVELNYTAQSNPADAVTTLPGGTLSYYQTTTTTYLDGQTMFYCDPQSNSL